MTLQILLNIDDLNFNVQQFIGSGICQFSKHNNIKDFLFCPNRGIQKYDLEQVKKILLSKKKSFLRLLDLSLIEDDISNDYSFLLLLENLIFLDLSDTGINSLENLGRMNKLKYLYLNNCENLFLIENNQMNYLENLVLLDLSGTNIISIPSEILRLQKLKILNLSSCDRLYSLPDSMSSLLSLEKLHVNNCPKLKKIPPGIGCLQNLKKLDINFNGYLENIPTFSNKLSCLSSFNLRGFNHHSFSLDLTNLVNLRELNLFSCSLTNLEVSHYNQLQVLFVNYCSNLINLNFMNYLNNLEKVSLSLPSVTSIPKSLFNSKKMSYLNIDCSSLKEVPNLFDNLINLKYLKLHDANNIDKLPSSIGSISQLKTFEFSGFKIKELLEEIGNLKSLTVLEITKCKFLAKVGSSILELSSLVKLYINMCPMLRLLPTNLITLPNLEIFECKYNKNLKVIPSDIDFGKSESKIKLQSLLLMDIGLTSKSFTGHDFEYLSSIHILNLSYNEFDILPEEISLVNSLKELILENCQNLITLPKSIFKLRKLEKIYLGGCLNFSKLPISNCSKEILENLQHLDLSYTYLKTILFNGNYGNKLKYLNLSNTDISFIPNCIGDFKNLMTLDLNGCRKISTLPEIIGNLKNLEFLHLRECTRFQRLPRNIIFCSNLEEINLIQTKCYFDYLPDEFKKKIRFSLARSNEELDY